jgi:hypothetical protein
LINTDCPQPLSFSNLGVPLKIEFEHNKGEAKEQQNSKPRIECGYFNDLVHHGIFIATHQKQYPRETDQ